MTSPAPSSGAPTKPVSAPDTRDALFNRSLRFEVAGEEGRALLTSYAFSFALGLAWLLFVYFGPRTLPMQLLSPEERPINVTFEALEPPPESMVAAEEERPVPVPAPGPKSRPRVPRRQQTSAGAIADAFGTPNGTGSGGLVGDVSNVLRNVAVASGSGSSPTAIGGGKVVLRAGEGGQGSRTPGRGGIGRGIDGGGIGGVGPGGGAVSRTPVRILPPRPIAAPSVGGVQRDVGELGTFVRSRESQLRFCYNEYGLKVNPALAGSVTAAVSLTPAGGVTGVNVTGRTWGGSGASETEQCIADKIRAWRFPSSEAGGGTYSFSFSFTR